MPKLISSKTFWKIYKFFTGKNEPFIEIEDVLIFCRSNDAVLKVDGANLNMSNLMICSILGKTKKARRENMIN